MNNNEWTTGDELNYLRKHAGRYLRNALLDISELDARIKVLAGYLVASEYRHDWGELDKQACVIRAHQELAKAKALKEEYGQGT